jgi:hypothetical protein
MKITVRSMMPFLLAGVMLTACDGFASSPAIPPVSATPRAATESPSPAMQSSPIPVSGIPTEIAFENGLTWLECVVPNGDYYHSTTDLAIITSCIDLPEWDEPDAGTSAERISGSNGSDLRLVIGTDVFLAKHDSTHGCCEYQFSKNGEVIVEINAPMITSDPNRHLWNIGGQAVWELLTDPPVIFVDGVNLNEKYQWEGSYFPYEVNGKLIYIARQNGKFHIVYDDEVLGPEFDEISMAYCCAKISVVYGNDQYWFLGTRAGTQYVVLIR